MPDKNVRRAAVSALRAWAKGHHYAEALIERQARRNRLSGADRALLQSIIFAVLRNRSLLDHWIGMLRKGKLDHETRDILRVGICQLLLLGLPDHAAVNETVACARSPVRGLINAVLRRAVAARKTLFSEREKMPAPLKYSHPEWLCKRWKKQFGQEETEALLGWNNEPAQVYLRPNPLSPHSFDADACSSLTHTAAVGFFAHVGSLPSAWTEEGLVSIQDPSTRHAVELLDPMPGETILDACAAPGGKAALIASRMRNEGVLHCTDRNEKRLPRLSGNLQRQHVQIARISTFDWTTPAPEDWQKRFDGILLDVPCSNTGVLRRRVDARWRLRAGQLSALQQLQSSIIEHALPCLKPGGRLVYSTCSLEVEENEAQISSVLRTYPGLTLEDSSQSLPFRDGFDGSFAALLRQGGT